MSAKHTSGPWRWEFNRGSKSVHLVGGRPQYDLTIMDFSRWGMSGAGINLRDTAHDGMNIMHKLQERSDWVAPFPGRKHHADWCADVVHPDMRLMASAPDLLEALILLEAEMVLSGNAGSEDYGWKPAIEKTRAAIARATGEPT